MPRGETILLTLRLPGTLTAATTRALPAALNHRHAQKEFFSKFDMALRAALVELITRLINRLGQQASRAE